MNTSTLVLLFQSLSGLVGLVVLWFVWVAGQRVDVLRRRLFAVRDELFDFAAAGNVDFREPAYNLLRNSMNGFIRYAHRLTCFQLLLTFTRWNLLGDVHPLTWNIKWEGALTSLPTETQQHLRVFHGRAMDLVARHLVLGSPFLVVALAIAMLTDILKDASRSLHSVFRDAAEKVITRFVGQNRLEEVAERAA